MTGTVAPGDAFFIAPSGSVGVSHLWVVLAVYTPDLSYEPYAAIVNITSMSKRADKTCLLTPGDGDAHPFVTHESFAFYGGIMEVEVAALLSLDAQTRRAPVCDALLSRLRAGLHRSPHARRGLRAVVPQK